MTRSMIFYSTHLNVSADSCDTVWEAQYLVITMFFYCVNIINFKKLHDASFDFPLSEFGSDFYNVLGESQNAGTVFLVVKLVLLRR